MKLLLIGYLTLIVCRSVLGQDENEEVPDFYEINVGKINSKSPVEFGVQLYSNDYERAVDLLSELGEVTSAAMWNAVWDVSGVAPAPVQDTEDRMDLWVDSIYQNLAGYMPTMLNTSKLLSSENIRSIATQTVPPNTFYTSTKYVLEYHSEDVEKHPDDTETYPDNEHEHYDTLIPGRDKEFAMFWLSSLKYLHNEGFELPYFEITDSPNQKKTGIFISPKKYANVLEGINKGLPGLEQTHEVVGPGTTTAKAAIKYIAELAKDRVLYDAIQEWSFQVTDTGSSLKKAENGIRKLKKFLKDEVDGKWPKKSMIAKFAFSPETSDIFDDVEFAGSFENCYKKLFGMHVKEEDLLPNSASQSPITAVRILANVLMIYGQGVQSVVYQNLVDHSWSQECFGMFDRQSRHKQIYAVLSTLLPHLGKDSYAIRKQWKNSESCFMAGFKSDSRIIFSVANSGSSVCTRGLSLSGAGLRNPDETRTDGMQQLLKVTSTTYNNGTVSLAAKEPWQALITTTPLEFDLYPSEEDQSQGVLEFDVVLRPHSSATVVIDIKEVDTAAVMEEEVKEDPTATTDETEEEVIEINADDEEDQPTVLPKVEL